MPVSSSELEGRVPVMPVRHLLIGMTGAHRQRFIEMSADQLKRERKPLRREAPRQP